MKNLVLGICLFTTCILNAQFAGPAGTVGSTAIAASSPLFVAWGNACTVVRGLKQINLPDSGFATYGNAADAVGMADNAVVSLGDSGVAVVRFNNPIFNGNGWDFAVFENSFSDLFLELAHVEVSTDSVHWHTFYSQFLGNDSQQIGPFDANCQPTKINNLAGKYRGAYGTPFDLEELNDSLINQLGVKYIRLTDALGSIDSAQCSRSGNGNCINDPFPTLFASSGFDLDAIGVLHNTKRAKQTVNECTIAYPVPTSRYLYLSVVSSDCRLVTYTGKTVMEVKAFEQTLDLQAISNGVYFLQTPRGTQKIIKW